MTRPIRTLLAGAGRIAFSLEKDSLRYHPCTHLGTLLALNRQEMTASKKFDLLAVSEPDHKKQTDFLAWYNLSSTNKPLMRHNTNDAIDELNPDFLIIATSPEAHCEILIHALKKNIPAILIEKPVCISEKQRKKIETIARQSASTVWVNFERRFHPDYIRIRRMVESEYFGTLRSIRGKVLTGTTSDAGGIGEASLLHDAIHWIDLLYWLNFRPQIISAFWTQSENNISINFLNPEQSAFLESAGNRHYFEFSMDLDFKNGRIIAGNNGFQYFESKPSQKYEGFRDLQSSDEIPLAENLYKNPWINLYTEIQNFFSNRSRTEQSIFLSSSPLDQALKGLQPVFQILKTVQKQPYRLKPLHWTARPDRE